MMHSRLAANTQTSWAANEMLRQDRVHIAGWYRSVPLCTRAPSSTVRVFSHPEPGGVPVNEWQQQHGALCIVHDTQ